MIDISISNVIYDEGLRCDFCGKEITISKRGCVAYLVYCPGIMSIFPYGEEPGDVFVMCKKCKIDRGLE